MRLLFYYFNRDDMASYTGLHDRRGGKGRKVTIDKSAFVPCTDVVRPMYRWCLYRERSATFPDANRIGCGILSHLQRSI